MYYLEILQKLRQCIADSLVHVSCTQTSANDHDDRFIGSKAAHVQSGQPAALCQLRTNGRTGQDSFVGRDIFHSLREIAAYLFCHGNAQLIGQSRCHIRFVDDTGNM